MSEEMPTTTQVPVETPVPLTSVLPKAAAPSQIDTEAIMAKVRDCPHPGPFNTTLHVERVVNYDRESNAFG